MLSLHSPAIVQSIRAARAGKYELSEWKPDFLGDFNCATSRRVVRSARWLASALLDTQNANDDDEREGGKSESVSGRCS